VVCQTRPSNPERAELQRLQQQFDVVLHAAGEGIVGQDCEGLTTFVNPAAARMLGWPPEQLIGRDMHTVLHGTRADRFAHPRDACPIYAAVADGRVHHATDEVFRRQNGTSFPVEYTCTPMRDGELVRGAVVIFNDISERVAAEAERASLYQKLLERDRDLREAVSARSLPRSNAPSTLIERDELARLTPRERDVLRGLANGQTNAEIARALGLGAGTVKSHVEHVLRKLGLSSRTHAALWAQRLGTHALSSERTDERLV
jgi:PAS domain S-box-containing protein